MPGVSDRLHAGRGVDEISGDHPLSDGAERHGSFAAEHAGAGGQPGGFELAPERGDRGDQVESRSNRALRIVLLRGRGSPYRHHRVPDELLDVPAVPLDHLPRTIEVAREQITDLLGVPILGESREADEVDEENGHDSTLDGRRRRVRVTGRSGHAVEGATALPAEALVGLVRGATRRADDGERRAAPRAELAPGAVDAAAGRARRAFRSGLGHGERIGVKPPASNHGACARGCTATVGSIQRISLEDRALASCDGDDRHVLGCHHARASERDGHFPVHGRRRVAQPIPSALKSRTSL